MNVFEVNSLDTIRPEDWDALWARCPDATVFQSREWVQAWFEVFGATDDLKLIAATQNGELVGLAPLVRKRFAHERGQNGEWHILGDDYSDYQVFLTHDGSQRTVQALLDALDRCLPHGATVALRDIPQFSSLGLCLAQRSRELASGIRAVGYTVCPTLCIRHNESGVTRVLAKASLKRHERDLLERGDLSIQHLSAAAEVEPLLDGLFAQHIARWNETGAPSLFVNADNQRFYRAVTRRLCAEDGVIFTAVRSGGAVVAQHFGLRSDNSLLWYKPAFDIALRRYSPGEVMLKSLIELARDRRWRELDFTRGDEAFKSRFASGFSFNRTFAWYRCSATRTRARVVDGVRATIRKLHEISTVGGQDDAKAMAGAARALVLDAETSAATTILRSLRNSGIDCDSVSAADETFRLERLDRYALVIPCTMRALQKLDGINEHLAIRAKAVMAPAAAMQAVIDQERLTRLARRAGLRMLRPAMRSPDAVDRHQLSRCHVVCLYVHGRLGWYFVDKHIDRTCNNGPKPSIECGAQEIDLILLARQMLDSLHWHGIATVRFEAIAPDGVMLNGIVPHPDDSVSRALQSGVDFAQGLWKIARGQRLGPQP